MLLSTLDYVTEIAPGYWTVLMECENRIPIRYSFRAGAIASYPEQYEHLSDRWLSTLDYVTEIALN